MHIYGEHGADIRRCYLCVLFKPQHIWVHFYSQYMYRLRCRNLLPVFLRNGRLVHIHEWRECQICRSRHSDTSRSPAILVAGFIMTIPQTVQSYRQDFTAIRHILVVLYMPGWRRSQIYPIRYFPETWQHSSVVFEIVGRHPREDKFEYIHIQCCRRKWR